MKLIRDKIDIGNGLFIYDDELGLYFGIYTNVNGLEVNLMDPTAKLDGLDSETANLMKRARETPRDKFYRKNMHALFPKIPLASTEASTPEKEREHTHPVKSAKELPSAEPNQYLVFDRMDEEQIKDEIEGRIIEDYFYDLQFGDRHVTGISYNGVKAATRWIAEKENTGIEIISVDVSESPDKFRYVVMARNTRLGITLPGMATQSKRMEIWNKQRTQKISVEDPYAENKAFSKAVRNALRSHLPEPLIIQMLEVYRSKIKHVKFDQSD